MYGRGDNMATKKSVNTPQKGYESNDWVKGGINVGVTTKPYPSTKGGKKNG